MCNDELMHYGKKGMRWTNHKYKVIKKGVKLSRVSLRPNEPIDANRKYVSTNSKDQKLWERIMVKPYKNMGYSSVYKYQYLTTKNVKVANRIEVGKQFTSKLMEDPRFTEKVIQGNNEFRKALGMKETDLTTDFFRSLGWRTNAASEFLQYMQSKGYDAINDIYGMESGAKDPIILLDPSKSIKLKSVEKI